MKDPETEKIVSLVQSIAKPGVHKILDVGCGYGRFLNRFSKLGYQIVGVEKNEQVVKENLAKGFTCINPETFSKSNATYDVILMSHIVEHFAPSDLLNVFNDVLSKLSPGGHLIIATPLLSNYFYDDFDHIKPYQPVGIQMMLCADQAQVQYRSTAKMCLSDIWFRRSPLKFNFCRGLYLKTAFPLTRVANIFFEVLYRVSFGLIAQTDGWVGLYQKLS